MVSKTAQRFWGKLEWLGPCERQLQQNLQELMWDGQYLPKCFVQGW